MPNYLTVHRLVVAAALLAAASDVEPATAELTAQHPVITPQIVFPLGQLRELAGTGGGVGVDWRPPVEFSHSIVVSAALVGFSRQKDAGVLAAVEGMMGLSGAIEISEESEVVAMPVLVGIEHTASDFHASLRVGNLYTRIEERTALYLGSRRDAGFNGTAKHGLLLAVSAAIRRGDVPLLGLQFNFAPGTRGPGGQSNLMWLALFASM